MRNPGVAADRLGHLWDITSIQFVRMVAWNGGLKSLKGLNVDES